MKNLALIILVIALGLFFLNRPTQRTVELKLTIAHQSNRYGVLEPCGCHTNPFGGIDREANAIDALTPGAFLYVDAGNLFLDLPRRGGINHHRKKATALVHMLNRTGLHVFGPGPNDFELGGHFLKQLSQSAQFKFVSTNVMDEKGTPFFTPFVIENREGFRIAVLSVIPEATPLPDGLQAISPQTALKKWLSKAHDQSDFVVLLSQLGSAQDESLSEQVKGIQVIVGADKSLSSDAVLYYARRGKTIGVDTHNNGYLLGHLTLEIKLPFKGFYSLTDIEKNRNEVASLEALLKQNPGDTELKKFVSSIKDKYVLKAIEGGSVYKHELIRLDVESYGKPNELTELVRQEKERIRQQALGE